MVALYFMNCNIGWVQHTLRVTPAVDAGLSDHFWSIEEIVGRWDRRVAMTASWCTEDSMAQKNTAEVDRAYTLRHLHELVAALDRRVPRVERAGEVAIARDAAALRKKALQRIAMLERKSGDNPT